MLSWLVSQRRLARDEVAQLSNILFVGSCQRASLGRGSRLELATGQSWW